MTAKARPPRAKCRFCGAKPMGLGALKTHVVNEHREQAARIEASLPPYPQVDRIDWGPRSAGIGHEFRKRMGYGPQDGAGPDVPGFGPRGSKP